MSWLRVSEDLCPSNEVIYVGTDKKGTCPNIQLAGSEFDGGNSLSHQWCCESESMERQKYALSQDEGLLTNQRLLSQHPQRRS